MGRILRVLAIVAFAVAVALRVLPDTPNLLDIACAIAVGLALYVAGGESDG